MQARQDSKLGLASGDSFVSNGQVWVKPLGAWADQNNRNGAYGYSARTYGILFGADSDLSATARIGAALAYTHSSVDSNLDLQNAKVNSYQAILYGTQRLGERQTELNWQADYGINRNKSERNISFIGQTASANYSSSSVHVGVGVGRTFNLNAQTSFTPSVRVDYSRIHDKGYSETGAGALNLVVQSQTIDEFIIGLDGKMTHALSDHSSVTGNLGVGYDTQAKQTSITSAFQGGGAAFTTNGVKPSPVLVRGGLGLALKPSKGVEITARYDIEARTAFTGQTVSVKARMAF